MTGEAGDAPAPEAFASVFSTYEVHEREDGGAVYYGEPLVDERELYRAVAPLFDDAGYDVQLNYRTGEFVLVAEPQAEATEGFPWTNVALALATIVSTLYAGSMWYYVSDPLSADILRAVPFTLAVMGVLGIHEFGHYAASKYHDVDATLPYFIPVPTLIGTMGAVIRMRGRIPSRRALFDIGVAGPLAGLAATILTAAVGLLLGPITVPQALLDAAASGNAVNIEFHYPLLMHGIAWALGEPLAYPNDPTKAVNPVVIGAWVGMFVTLLNLIPVGQLDGGHVLSAMLGDAHARVAGLVPAALFALAGYLYAFTDAGQAAFVWVLWGVIGLFMAWRGSVPTMDDQPLDRRRFAVGVLTFVLGALCFVPVPIQITPL
ncbi:site-2 protease family protein [Halocalculus aciditolerans]|uniref:Site-2 protease family protein n=1 Tax=Halocalculus aciditolerans TaxID=1383812 RepID=A0A830FG92_9EURY|nr:site-2 protease family protein [Halocalculus aciditolerans]GGL50093.1 site-2 protease family protein [Halocalculus aciditolerans]